MAFPPQQGPLVYGDRGKADLGSEIVDEQGLPWSSSRLITHEHRLIRWNDGDSNPDPYLATVGFSQLKYRPIYSFCLLCLR